MDSVQNMVSKYEDLRNRINNVPSLKKSNKKKINSSKLIYSDSPLKYLYILNFISVIKMNQITSKQDNNNQNNNLPFNHWQQTV